MSVILLQFTGERGSVCVCVCVYIVNLHAHSHTRKRSGKERKRKKSFSILLSRSRPILVCLSHSLRHSFVRVMDMCTLYK
jgi:hypothetical protein